MRALTRGEWRAVYVALKVLADLDDAPDEAEAALDLVTELLDADDLEVPALGAALGGGAS